MWSKRPCGGKPVVYVDEDVWTVLNDGSEEAPSRRKGVPLVYSAQDQSLYLFGGAGPGLNFNDLWKFDLIERRWYNESTKCMDAWSGHHSGEDVPYPVPRAYHVLQIFNSKLVVYGGYGVNDDSEMYWEYDLRTHQWKNVIFRDANPGLRFGLAACIHNESLYICTGQLQSRLVSSTLWRLDLRSKTWQQVVATGAPPTPRTYAAHTLLRPHGRWLIHGGSSSDTVFNDTYELDLNTFHWHPSLILCTPPTLEGHTLDALQTQWESTCLFLLGGATSGPIVPSGPIARCDLFLRGLSSQLKVEDFCIRLPIVADMLWDLHRSRIAAQEK
ncbi:kelch repeat protein [Gregarina niphandrodes]|uniref:Kelch repeat protein n=1 Tax=Gregarina niphandrodes TaxID=110365 RepID=A0A023B349_GRENI|nr:kelch repeat protein [Gregarina niphandrodes]EZG55353.1 kelch repeat protein [Gregarina niphandrodes]|eukprot:XP_011131619.1 kelch repeat protein [Gregarina niphandrodes]